MEIETYLETLVQVPGRNDFSTRELNRQLEIVKECVLASTDYPYRIGRCWATGCPEWIDFRFDIVSDDIRSEDIFRLDVSVDATDPKWYIHLFVEDIDGSETLPGVEMEFKTTDGSFQSLEQCLADFRAKYDAKVADLAKELIENNFSDKKESIEQIRAYLKVATDLATKNGFKLALDNSTSSCNTIFIVPAEAFPAEIGTPGALDPDSLPQVDFDHIEFDSNYDSICLKHE